MSDINVLLICDDYWHPAEIVEKGIRAFSENSPGYRFDIVHDGKDILTPEMLERYPVIINAKNNSINSANKEPWFEAGVSEVCPAQIREYVEKGGHLIVIHSGSAFNEKMLEGYSENFTKPNSEYIDLVGCRFLYHPPRCETTYHVAAKEHPVMKGVEDFTVRDEHYHLDVFADPVEVILTSSSESGGEGIIAGYEKKAGEGIILVLTPGHNLDVWLHPQFQKMLKNAIDYCAEK